MSITPLGGRHIGYGLGKTQRREATALPLFADGFESGDFSAWSSTSGAGAYMLVTPDAALVGTYGMKIDFAGGLQPKYIIDQTPNSETRYRFRFYFDPNGMTIPNTNGQSIFLGYSATYDIIIEFRINAGVYEIRGRVRADTVTLSTSYFAISDAPHYIEVDWKMSSAPGANDGHLRVYIDGEFKGSMEAVDNDTKGPLGYVQLGFISGGVLGTSGAYYFDAFESNNTGAEIGPA